MTDNTMTDTEREELLQLQKRLKAGEMMNLGDFVRYLELDVKALEEIKRDRANDPKKAAAG